MAGIRTVSTRGANNARNLCPRTPVGVGTDPTPPSCHGRGRAVFNGSPLWVLERLPRRLSFSCAHEEPLRSPFWVSFPRSPFWGNEYAVEPSTQSSRVRSEYAPKGRWLTGDQVMETWTRRTPRAPPVAASGRPARAWQTPDRKGATVWTPWTTTKGGELCSHPWRNSANDRPAGPGPMEG